MKIDEAKAADVPDIVDLLNEVDRSYGDETTEGWSERASQVTSVLFGPTRSAHAILARTWGGQAIGFASYSFLWPAAGSSRSLYLKELYVTNAHRKSSVGRQLMKELFKIAKRENCSRVEWTTDVANVDAQDFYEKIGESPFSGKLFYRHEIA